MNAFDVVAQFEQRIADYAGSRYAVAVDCCTNALFLCCKYVQARHVIIPARTYCSVPMAIIHSGATVEFEDRDWKGIYQLKPYSIYDGAKRFKRNMYEVGLHCLSFHTKKILNIGRGGMILTDDLDAVEWLRRARYDGREGKNYPGEVINMLGWHMVMSPEQAARGLMLLDVHMECEDQTEDYPDLRTFPVFQ